MDIHSVIESFAEAWVAANTQTPLTEAAASTAPDAVSSGDSGSTSSGRPSIPIRCVIERQECSEDRKTVALGDGGGTTPSTSLESRKESGLSSPPQQTTSSRLEQDTFAIIPPCVPFQELVKTALIKLGYSSTEAVGAKGLIQLRNWKALTFDQITDSSEATVSDILGEVSSVITLRIRLFRPKGNAAHEVKDKLLQILLAHSQNLLVNSGCPIDQHLLTSLCGRSNRSPDSEIPEETRKKFDQWYFQQLFNHYRQFATLQAAAQQAQHQQQQAAAPLTSVIPSIGGGRRTQDSVNGHIPHLFDHDSKSMKGDSDTSPISDQAGHASQFVRTRIRTSFDPDLELPKLHKWFAENQHPTRAQIQLYVKELNSLESRRGRKPLDINNVVYWFKNARAAHKRQELKFVNGSPIKSVTDIKDENDPNGHHRRDDGDDSGRDDFAEGDRTDDDSSQYSQTLDLTMRSVKRRRSHSSEGASPVISNEIIKDESGSEDEGEVSSDAEGEKFYEKYYSHALTSTGHALYPTNGPNGQTFPPFGLTTTPNISNGGNNPDSPDTDGRRIRRSRTFIDPMTEVPRLENWFSTNTHPTHSQIVKYTEELNRLQYRQKFPKLEPKNIQFWFKNRRAKFKRLSLPSSNLAAVASTTSTNGFTSSSQVSLHSRETNQSPPTSCASPTSSCSPLGQSTNITPTTYHSTSPTTTVTSALNIERLIGN